MVESMAYVMIAIIYAAIAIAHWKEATRKRRKHKVK